MRFIVSAYKIQEKSKKTQVFVSGNSFSGIVIFRLTYVNGFNRFYHIVEFIKMINYLEYFIKTGNFINPLRGFNFSC